MKKLLVLVVLLLTFTLVGCNKVTATDSNEVLLEACKMEKQI
jgi:uncharacterized lipoprotein NlpE involved in copper resistance